MKAVFVSHSRATSQKAEALIEALTRREVTVVRTDNDSFRGEWQSQLLSNIRRCSLFLAFVDEPSPAVMLGLGYALGAGKDVLLVAGPGASVPFDIASMRVLRLDSSDVTSVDSVAELVLSNLYSTPPLSNKGLRGRENLLEMLRNPEYLEAVSPREFEETVVDFFEQIGMKPIRTPDQMDGGYDVLWYGPHQKGPTMIQIKKYSKSSRLGVANVHQFLGSMFLANAAAGILISTAEFSTSAKRLAERSPLPVRLMSLEELIELGERR
jgi:restriction endonuclease